MIISNSDFGTLSTSVAAAHSSELTIPPAPQQPPRPLTLSPPLPPSVIMSQLSAAEINAMSPPGGAPLLFDADRKRGRAVVIEIDSDSESDDDDVVVLDGAPQVGVSMDGLPVYEAERIVTMQDTSRGRRFFVQWRGYAQKTWKYEEELDGCQALVYEYLERRRQQRRRH